MSALRAMIRLEAQTLEALREEVNGIAAEAAHVLNVGSEAEIVAAIRNIASRMEGEITQIILSARTSATSLAFSQVVIEARLDGLESEEDPEDEARAVWVAAAFAAAFVLAALGAVRSRSDVKKIARLQDYRLRRIAATEVAQAYGAACLRAYAFLDPAYYAKRWDATLDMKTCAVCRDHHGETVALEQPFRNGDEPGDVHPNCRCVPEIILV